MRFSVDIENKEQVVNWLERLKKGTDDARPFWNAMTPKINEFVDKQFDPASDSGKGWKSLKPKYKTWKIKKGYSPAIGVMTGRLREGAGVQSSKKYKKKELIWAVNQNHVQDHGVRYAGYFNAERSIYKRIALRLNSFLGIDIKKFEGGSHNSFTYIWLRNELRKLQ